MPLALGMVNDGLHNFRSSGICYIRPDLQVRALAALGLLDISCLRHDDPVFFDGSDPRVATLAGPWIYYVCRTPPGGRTRGVE